MDLLVIAKKSFNRSDMPHVIYCGQSRDEAHAVQAAAKSGEFARFYFTDPEPHIPIRTVEKKSEDRGQKLEDHRSLPRLLAPLQEFMRIARLCCKALLDGYRVGRAKGRKRVQEAGLRLLEQRARFSAVNPISAPVTARAVQPSAIATLTPGRIEASR